MTTSMIAWYCMTRIPMTTFIIAWHCTMRTPTITSTERECAFPLVCQRSLVFTSSAHTCTVAQAQEVCAFTSSTCALCLGKIHQYPKSNEAWTKRIEWITSSQSYRDFDGISGEPTEFEWNIFPGFGTLQLCVKAKDLLSRLGETPENFTGRILFMSMFNDISCDKKDNEKNVWHRLKSYLCMQGSLVQDNGHSLVPVLRKSGIL